MPVQEYTKNARFIVSYIFQGHKKEARLLINSPLRPDIEEKYLT